MLHIVVPAIEGCSDQLNDGHPDDGDEQDEPKDSVGDHREVESVDALQTSNWQNCHTRLLCDKSHNVLSYVG